MLTPPHHPGEKRVTSNMSSNTDAGNIILAELQASVRSSLKKRIERERAEKERKQRELDLIAKKAKEATEHGSLKIADPEEKDHVLREIRSWRKQREASLKGVFFCHSLWLPALNTLSLQNSFLLPRNSESRRCGQRCGLHREAFSNGEIMAGNLDLQHKAAPCVGR